MTPAETLALAALALFLAVSLWLGLTQPRPRPPRVPLPQAATGFLQAAAFRPQPVLSPCDQALLTAVEAQLRAQATDHRIAVHLALAAAVRPASTGNPATDSAVAAAIASRRIDIAILDPAGRVAAALTRPAPDPITLAVLRKAGIPVITADRNTPPDRLAARIATALTP
jgi:hypothetical protein